VWYNKQVETFKIITMHEPTYRQALSHSWKLAWHHKLIWIFGLFAAFLGQMGLLELLGSVSMHASSSSATLGLGNLTWIKMLCAGELRVSLPITGWVWLVWLLVMFLGFGIFLIFVSVSSQGALIHASAQWAKKDTLPDTDKSWHAGVQHFWPLFFINVFKKCFICALGMAVSWGAVNALIGTVTGWDLALFLLLFILAALVGMVLSFLVVYVAGFVVVEKYPLSWAIPAAWKMFIKHWLVSVEVGVIILVLNVLVSAVALIGFIVFLVPTLITWFIASVISNGILWMAGLVIGCSLFVLFIIFLGSVFTVFTTSVWTYLFMKMHRVGIVSKILHVFK